MACENCPQGEALPPKMADHVPFCERPAELSSNAAKYLYCGAIARALAFQDPMIKFAELPLLTEEIELIKTAEDTL